MSKNTPMGPLFASGLILVVLVGCFVGAHSGGGGNEIADNSMTAPAPADEPHTQPIAEDAQGHMGLPSDHMNYDHSYDPDTPEKVELARRVGAYVNECVYEMVFTLGSQGLSRDDIKQMAVSRCGPAMINNHVMPKADTIDWINSLADLNMGNMQGCKPYANDPVKKCPGPPEGFRVDGKPILDSAQTDH